MISPNTDAVASLTFRFSLEPAEYARCVMSMARASSRRYFGLVFVGIPFLPIIMEAVTGDHRWMAPGAVVTFLALSALGYLWYGKLGQRFRIQRSKKRSPLMQVEWLLEISPVGLRTAAGPATNTMAWSGISRVYEDQEFYLFFFSERSAYYLPKRLLSGGTQEEALRVLIRAHAPDAGANLARDATRVPT